MTALRLGFWPAFWIPLIIRSAPNQDSYWPKLGKSVFEKCWYLIGSLMNGAGSRRFVSATILA